MPLLARFSAACAVVLAFAALPAQTHNRAHVTRMEIVHGKPYVMVMVNGKGPFRFVIDTGTGGQALITSALADQLQLPVVGQARLTDPSGQGEQRAPVLLIQSLNVAGVDFKDISAIRHSLGPEEDACQGVLGFALFRDYLLTLDYPQQELTLAPGALKPDGERSVLPFHLSDGVPIFSLHLDGATFEAQLDSGGIGLSLPTALAAHLRFDVDPELIAISQSLSTRFPLKAGRLGSDVRVGRYTFTRPIVEINPAFPLANFGACAMQNFAITFDQNNLLVRLNAEGNVFRLNVLPTLLRLQNSPDSKPPDQALVPVG